MTLEWKGMNTLYRTLKLRNFPISEKKVLSSEKKESLIPKISFLFLTFVIK